MKNKKKKGFTLIELLAIIVILAIIAVITVPIILNIIDNAKKGAAIDSAYGYKDAINQYYVSRLIDEPNFRITGTYTIDENGKLTRQSEEIEIPVNGQKPVGGELTYENQKILSGCLTINGYKVTFNDNEVEGAEKGICYEQVTITFDQNYEGSEAITRTAKVDKQLGQIIPTPERNHYGLIGWFTEREGGTEIGASTQVTGKTTYYAHWQAGSITVTLDPGLGTIENSTIAVTVGNTINSTINGTFKDDVVPTRQGYEFLGWFTASEGGTEVNGTETLNDDTRYYAHWQKSSALTYTDTTDDGEISVGDWVKIADEEFEVINPNKNGNVVLLAQYNLFADNNLVWKQDLEDSYFTPFSTSVYWYGVVGSEPVCEEVYVCTASASASASSSGESSCHYENQCHDENVYDYIEDYETDSQGYKYIYRTRENEQSPYTKDTANNLFTAINGYKSYLEEQGANIEDVRLMSYAEAISLTLSQRLANDQQYWLGSEDSDDNLGGVWINTPLGIRGDMHDAVSNRPGVRPVIEIPISEF